MMKRKESRIRLSKGAEKCTTANVRFRIQTLCGLDRRKPFGGKSLTRLRLTLRQDFLSGSMGKDSFDARLSQIPRTIERR
jgi:hypothetical protein